jgi:hypothetical protein
VGEVIFNCEVACRMCGWNIEGIVAKRQRDTLNDVMAFVEQHWPEHGCTNTASELLISWHPMDTEVK